MQLIRAGQHGLNLERVIRWKVENNELSIFMDDGSVAKYKADTNPGVSFLAHLSSDAVAKDVKRDASPVKP